MTRLILTFLLLTTGVFSLIAQGRNEVPIDTSVAKVTQLIDLIMQSYVDQQDKGKLSDYAIEGILKEMDPHSVYIPAKKVKDFNEPLRGDFEGVGIQFNILFDTIMVVTPISGGPSEKIGLRAGDKIIFIDEENVAGTGISNSGVAKRLRGKKGTKVEVQVKRRGEKELLDFTITRDKIPLTSLDAAYMVNQNTGYIKLFNFANTTYDEFEEARQKLTRDGMENMILDLRGNGGGFLHIAIQLADQFLEANQLIVYTEGKHSPRREAKSTGMGRFRKGKLIILIDEGSASASEIVSGAVQDYDRGIIVGRRSFGKGLVQSEMKLIDGSSVRLTTARYYTPTGRSIQKPYNEGNKKYREELSNRFKEGELTDEDKVKIADSLKFYTPNNRMVYGGGGIYPDVFVPLDTTRAGKLYSTALRKGHLTQFALDYADKHRDELIERYIDVEDYDENYNASKVFTELVKFMKDKKIEFSKKEIKASKEFTQTQLKSLLARNLWGSSAYYQIFNKTDRTFQEAVKLMNDANFKDYLAGKR